MRVWMVLGFGLALAACGERTDADAGARDAGTDAATPTDAGVDAGADAGGSGDAGPPDAGPPVIGIEGAIGAEDGPVDARIEGVLVTYLRPAIGSDRPGFFVQSEAAGPAIFVQVEPTVVAGDRVTFRGTEVQTLLGHKRITAIADLVVESSGNDLGGLVQDVSSASDLGSSLATYAHELIAVDVTITGTPEVGGAGFTRAVVDTPSVSGDIRLQLRLPDPLWGSFVSPPLAVGCSMHIEGTPLWPYNENGQISAWDASEISGVTCP